MLKTKSYITKSFTAFKKLCPALCDCTDNECPICFEQIQQPKVLPCNHKFCLHCLRKIACTEKNILNCPLCRNEHKLPSGGTEGFPSSTDRVCSGRGIVAGAEGARTPTDDFEKYGENTEVWCKLCGDKYPYNHMESHVVGVHGLNGPKEMYMDDQSTSLVRSISASGTHDSKSVPQPLRVCIDKEEKN
jgi:tripartite motif-containing protein 2/3